MEILRDDEIETASEIVAVLRRLMDAARLDAGRAMRPAFAKGEGLLRGELAVIEDLPAELRQGVFAEPRVHPVVLRLSAGSGDPGRMSPRGAALKIVGVSGERLPGAEGGATQDFVLADAPVFSAPDARAFLKNLKLLAAAAADRPDILRRAVPAALRGGEALIEAALGRGAAPAPHGGGREGHLLATTFHSQAPLLFGPYVARLRMAPVGPELASLRRETIDVGGRPHAHGEAVADFFESQSAEFELGAQLLTDPAAMPIEDASVDWPQALSPYRPLARITVPPQRARGEAEMRELEESLSFSPWQGLAAHRPLGSIMRARRPAYAMSASFRASRNGCPIHDPRSEADLPF